MLLAAGRSNIPPFWKNNIFGRPEKNAQILLLAAGRSNIPPFWRAYVWPEKHPNIASPCSEKQYFTFLEGVGLAGKTPKYCFSLQGEAIFHIFGRSGKPWKIKRPQWKTSKKSLKNTLFGGPEKHPNIASRCSEKQYSTCLEGVGLAQNGLKLLFLGGPEKRPNIASRCSEKQYSTFREGVVLAQKGLKLLLLGGPKKSSNIASGCSEKQYPPYPEGVVLTPPLRRPTTTTPTTTRTTQWRCRML